MCVFMYVYVFAIGARTVGATGLKFGTELGLHSEKVITIMQAGGTHPGGTGALNQGPDSQNSAFVGKLYKTKVEELVCADQVR